MLKSSSPRLRQRPTTSWCTACSRSALTKLRASSNRAKISAFSIGVKTSIGGLGTVQVNLDTTVLQAVLQQLTGAIDAKFETVCAQLAEVQADMAAQRQMMETTRRELSEVSTTVSTCVTWKDLDDVKTMESRMKAQFSKQLERVSSEAASAVEKLRETKAEKDVVDRLIDRESVERLATMEVALSQQRIASLEGRCDGMEEKLKGSQARAQFRAIPRAIPRAMIRALL